MQRITWRTALCCGIGLVLFGSAVTPFASATIYTFSPTNTAQEPSANPDANGSVDLWTHPGDSANAGDFVGNSANNGDGSNSGGTGAGSIAWGLYANGGASSTATSKTFTSLIGSPISLANQYIAIDFDNGYVDPSSKVGISFYNASNQVQLTFEFVGGDTNYKVTDSTGSHVNPPSLGFTDNGFNVKLTLNNNSNGQYTLNVGASSISGVLQRSSSIIDKIEVFNINAGNGSSNDVYFNNLVVSTAVPEVPAGMLLAVVGTVFIGANKWKSLRRAKRAAKALMPSA